MYPIEFSLDEIKALLLLIHEGVKATGLTKVESAAHFKAKLEGAVKAQQQTTAEK